MFRAVEGWPQQIVHRGVHQQEVGGTCALRAEYRSQQDARVADEVAARLHHGFQSACCQEWQQRPGQGVDVERLAAAIRQAKAAAEIVVLHAATPDFRAVEEVRNRRERLQIRIHGSQLAADVHVVAAEFERWLPHDALDEGAGLIERNAKLGVGVRRRHVGMRVRGDGRVEATQLARLHLDSRSPHYIGDYFALASGLPGVLSMVERLRTDRPAGSDGGGGGVGFIYREGMRSAMEGEEGARFFTMALAGRARNVAPTLATAATVGQSWAAAIAAAPPKE
mgnify:CR=1 FL=1